MLIITETFSKINFFAADFGLYIKSAAFSVPRQPYLFAYCDAEMLTFENYLSRYYVPSQPSENDTIRMLIIFI